MVDEIIISESVQLGAVQATGPQDVIDRASAICTRDEGNWKGRDEFAIKSMATTRATGKAYRLAFSWIMNLAGYESTPAEEMDGIVPKDITPKQPEPDDDTLTVSPEIIEGIKGWPPKDAFAAVSGHLIDTGQRLKPLIMRLYPDFYINKMEPKDIPDDVCVMLLRAIGVEVTQD